MDWEKFTKRLSQVLVWTWAAGTPMMAGEGWGGCYSQRGKAGGGGGQLNAPHMHTWGPSSSALGDPAQRHSQGTCRGDGAAVRWGCLGAQGAMGERTRSVQRWARWRAVWVMETTGQGCTRQQGRGSKTQRLEQKQNEQNEI